MTKVELVKGTAFEIKPDSKYLIVFDKHEITNAEVFKINQELHRMGADGVSVLLGDINKLRIVEL